MKGTSRTTPADLPVEVSGWSERLPDATLRRLDAPSVIKPVTVLRYVSVLPVTVRMSVPVKSCARFGAWKPSLYEPRTITQEMGFQFTPYFGFVVSPKSV